MGKRELSYIVGNVNQCCHCGQQYEGALKTKNRATTRASNPLPGLIFGKDENSNLKRHMHPNVRSSAIHNSEDIETT